MRIAVVSDLHLEFAELEILNTDQAQVLILAGDICTARAFSAEYPQDRAQQQRQQRYLKFFDQVSREFPHVLYVMGNHEHYNHDFHDTETVLRAALAEFQNLVLLENTSVEIQDHVFMGATLWTDMNKGTSMAAVQHIMNDYSVIRNRLHHRKLRPQDTLDQHQHSLSKLSEMIARDQHKPVCMITHMAPSPQSVHPRYAADIHGNSAYFSDLESWIHERANIKAWIHGHTHHAFDYHVANTRVICNPRGYVPYERGTQAEQPYYAKILDL